METKRAFPIVIVFLLLIPFAGGLYWYSQVALTGRQMSVEERENELAKPLMDAKEVKLTFQEPFKELRVRTIAKADRQLLIDCLDDATLEPNALKWEVVGAIYMTDARSAEVKWHLYYISSRELAYSNEKHQYWRGVRTARIAELVAGE